MFCNSSWAIVLGENRNRVTMGGCCSSSRGAELVRSPIYFYHPQEIGNESLSSTRGTSSAVSAGLLVDTNLETSIPDTYLAPSVPLPYDVGMVFSQSMHDHFKNCGNKIDHMQLADSQPMVEAEGRFQSSDISEVLDKSDCKVKTDLTLDSSKLTEDEPMKLDEPVASDLDEEDVCPTCLEEYDVENPRIITKCEHHFHLSCILEWMERSDSCPICDQIMVIDHASDG